MAWADDLPVGRGFGHARVLSFFGIMVTNRRFPQDMGDLVLRRSYFITLKNRIISLHPFPSS
jgi:hypothetical protein